MIIMKLTNEKLIELGFKSYRNCRSSRFEKNHVILWEIFGDNIDSTYQFCYDIDNDNIYKQINTVEELTFLYEFLTETTL